MTNFNVWVPIMHISAHKFDQKLVAGSFTTIKLVCTRILYEVFWHLGVLLTFIFYTGIPYTPINMLMKSEDLFTN